MSFPVSFAEKKCLDLLVRYTRRIIILTDPQRRITWVNQAFTDVTGYTAKESLGKNPGALLQGADTNPETITLMREALNQGRSFRTEILNYSKTGQPYWLELEIEPVHDLDGKLISFLGVQVDITERKSSEIRLRNDEEKFRKIFEVSHQGKAISRLSNGQLIDANQAFLDLYQYRREELLGNHLHAVGIWENPSDLIQTLEQLTRQCAVWSYTCWHLDRHKKRLNVSVNASVISIDGEDCVIWSMTDISQNTRQIEELKKREEMLTLLAETAFILLGGENPDPYITPILEKLGQITKQSKAAVLSVHTLPGKEGRYLSQSYHWTDASVTAVVDDSKLVNLTLETDLPSFLEAFLERRILERQTALFSGREREIMDYLGIVSVIAIPISSDDQIWGFLGLANCHQVVEWNASDLSFLKSFAALLGSYFHKRERLSEMNQLRRAVEQSEDTIVITDAQGIIEYVNPSFETTSGYTREEAIGQNPRILKSEAQSDTFYREMWNTLTSGKAWSGRIINRAKDGTLFHELANISPITNSKGSITHYVALKKDITREIEREAHLLQAQKMESIGQLAGGVAHDYNNMLSVILTHAEMALEGVGDDLEMVEHLHQIKEAGTRSANLTRQLLNLAKKHPIQPCSLNVNESLSEMVSMLNTLVGENIRIQFLPGPLSPDIWMDPGQFEQVILNLVLNARDAMPDGGLITISSGSEPPPLADMFPFSSDHSDSYTGIYVHDQGLGMDSETLQRIFEPFFTTKPLNQGTGLGLSTVYAIIKQNNGLIEAHSKLGEGSVFRVLLPISKAPSVTPSNTIAPSISPRQILLVEDEPTLLHIVKRLLEKSGHHVYATLHAKEALEWATLSPKPVDLLVSDVLMPEMNGWDLACALHAQHPAIKCILLSGYPSDILEKRNLKDINGIFLSKPFSIKQFSQTVETMLS
ncbi:MAG: PAS domain-containing protein [Candidatus Methylacidiphilales bacterium]